jgi:hypothetical protein
LSNEGKLSNSGTTISQNFMKIKLIDPAVLDKLFNINFEEKLLLFHVKKKSDFLFWVKKFVSRKNPSPP